MNSIENLIFDCLAAGYGINLPGVGALNHHREPARIISNKEIAPPKRKITFTPQENPEYESIADIIASSEQISPDSARQTYDEWLSKTKSGNILEIKDVGVIKDNTFYISEALYETLNPRNAAAAMAATPSCNRRGISWLTAAILLLSLLVIGAVIYLAITMNLLSDARLENAKPDTENTTALTEGEEDAVLPENGNTENTTTVATDNTPPMYYLVAGVFSIESNADNLIKQDPLFLGDMRSYEKHPFKDGKTMVTVFKSPNKNAVERRMYELEWSGAELWIHEGK